jgi:hypothetical protein
MMFYLFQNGQQAGPYTEDRLRELLTAGQIQGSDLAWRDGLAEWAPLASLIPMPPPVTPVPPPPVVALRPLSDFETKTRSKDRSGLVWILAGLGLLIFLLICAGIGFAVFKGIKLDASSDAYADDYISHIAPQWSSSELMSRVTPEYSNKFDPATMQSFFRKLSGLGNLKKYGGSTGNSNVNFNATGKHVTATVQAKATFENGDATFKLLLVQVGGKWTIAGFHVESPIFYR